jgi:spore coat polysaccharide biosynthesis protein SpsF
MGSTRLKGKVMMDLEGEPMLVRCINRLSRARSLTETVVATTTRNQDDAIARLCSTRSWLCFRGDEQDLLDRYYRAALAFKADAVVRITSDCPLIDPAIVDMVVNKFTDVLPNIDYVSTSIPKRTFPRSLDTEVMSMETLDRAWREDNNPAWREHVTPYIYRNPQLFLLQGVTEEKDYSYMRWTVDTQEDLTFVRKIYERFGHDDFTWKEVTQLLEVYPEWLEINRHVKQKTI